MRITIEEKLKMCEEHVLNGKSLSHVSELYNGYSISNLKYLINLYKKYGTSAFIDREQGVYKRDTKLLGISRVKHGESIRSVAGDLGLIEPKILADWIKIYDQKGEAFIKDTYPRRSYMVKNQRAKYIVDQTLKEENERLKAEIEFLKKSPSLTQKLEGVTNKEKSIIVTELRKTFKLSVLLVIADLPSSVYYYHHSGYKKKVYKYKEVEQAIDDLYLNKHKKCLGYQRIHLELKNMGFTIGKNKVLEIMRSKNYLKKKIKKWRRFNSYEGDLGYTKPNLMNQDFKTTKPYEKAGTDITIFPISEETVYLSSIIDFNSREVLAHVAAQDAKMDKITQMLNQLADRHQDKLLGMMMQSDQGIQYQNSRYVERLKDLGIIQSMSRKGNCLDNSPTENFFGRMKTEMWYGHEHEYKNANQLIKAIDEYITYYNYIRPVTKLKMSPIEYRHQLK